MTRNYRQPWSSVKEILVLILIFVCFLLALSGASRVAMSESDSSSLNSVELDGLGMANAVDSDTGLESMSSAETPSGKPCSLCCCDAQNNDLRVEGLRQDVTRLKCDKLELLRQNVVSAKFFLDFF